MLVILIFVFLMGFLSDINYLFSPVKRLILQIIIVLLFINFDQIFINSIRIEMFEMSMVKSLDEF